MIVEPAVTHRRMGQGAGGGGGGCSPQNLGSKRNLGKANFSRSLHVCVHVVFFFFEEKHFPF